MAVKAIYTHLDGQSNELRNWSGEKLAVDPTGGDLYTGRQWFNTAENKLKFYDGTAVQTVASLADITSIGQFQGTFDASAGVPSTTLDSSAIVAGDYWRVATAGTIAGIGGDDVLEVGDLVFANVAAASAAADFAAVQANLDLPADLGQVEEVALANLPANTATAVPSSFTNMNVVQVFNSADEEIEVCIAGPITARTLESNQALTGLKVQVVGS